MPPGRSQCSWEQHGALPPISSSLGWQCPFLSPCLSSSCCSSAPTRDAPSPAAGACPISQQGQQWVRAWALPAGGAAPSHGCSTAAWRCSPLPLRCSCRCMAVFCASSWASLSEPRQQVPNSSSHLSAQGWNRMGCGRWTGPGSQRRLRALLTPKAPKDSAFVHRRCLHIAPDALSTAARSPQPQKAPLSCASAVAESEAAPLRRTPKSGGVPQPRAVHSASGAAPPRISCAVRRCEERAGRALSWLMR